MWLLVMLYSVKGSFIILTKEATCQGIKKGVGPFTDVARNFDWEGAKWKIYVSLFCDIFGDVIMMCYDVTEMTS